MKRSILVVDDDHDVVEVLVALLDEEGYRVRYAFDGQAALRAIAHTAPDLVLADVMMPQVDGVSLARHLRVLGWTMPVVLMSAVYAYVDVPSLHFIAKPFDLDDLLGVITRVLQDRAAQEAAGEAPPFRTSKRPRAGRPRPSSLAVDHGGEYRGPKDRHRAFNRSS
jgi:DNA-binding response OmpR family regulator